MSNLWLNIALGAWHLQGIPGWPFFQLSHNTSLSASTRPWWKLYVFELPWGLERVRWPWSRRRNPTLTDLYYSGGLEAEGVALADGQEVAEYVHPAIMSRAASDTEPYAWTLGDGSIEWVDPDSQLELTAKSDPGGTLYKVTIPHPTKKGVTMVGGISISDDMMEDQGQDGVLKAIMGAVYEHLPELDRHPNFEAAITKVVAARQNVLNWRKTPAPKRKDREQ